MPGQSPQMANSIFNQVSSLGPSRSPLVRGGNGSGSRVGTWAGVMSRSGATVLPLIGCGWGNAPGLYPCGQGRTGRSGHCACPGAFLRDLPTSSFGPLPPTSGGLPKSEKSPCFLPGPGRHENVAGPPFPTHTGRRSSHTHTHTHFTTGRWVLMVARQWGYRSVGEEEFAAGSA